MLRTAGPTVTLAWAIAVSAIAPTLSAQEPRLAGRLPERELAAVNAVLDSARADDLPTEPLVDRALEGVSKGAAPALIVQVVRRLAGELRQARAAFGGEASTPELTAGASALRAGASVDDLAELRALRQRHSLTVAAAVLADLVAVGVPADTAVAAVLALADRVDDATYVAFRRNVERDIALGASPVAALGVRLDANALSAESLDRAPSATGPRKP